MQNGRARRGLFCRQFGAVGEGSAFDDLVIVVTCKSTRFHSRYVNTFISNDCDSSMYYHFVLAAIEMPWYIAIVVMVLCFSFYCYPHCDVSREICANTKTGADVLGRG